MSTPKRDTRLLFMVFLGLMLLFAMTYAGRLAQQAALTRELVRWDGKNERSIDRQHALEAELRYVQSNAYVEEIAHDEFGMVLPPEKLVVILPDEEAATAAPAVEDRLEDQPFWYSWLARFGWQLSGEESR